MAESGGYWDVHSVNDMKKIIIVILIILIILTLLVYAISLIKKQSKPQPSPIPQISPQPTANQQLGSLKIISVYPSPDELDEVSQGARITVTFDKNIETATFKYTSNPSLEIATDFATNSVIFRPKTFWPLDTKVTITILYAKGDKGGILNNPYQIEFLSPAPTGL